MARRTRRKIAETTKLLGKKSNTKEKELEVHLNDTLNATLKWLKGTLLREVANMISTQIKK